MSDIRVLVVDDSAVIRQIICDCLEATPGMAVAGTAEDGVVALEMAAQVHPDVVTLDIQMPKMDGLTTLEALLAQQPVPVVMASAVTRLGAVATLDALDHGAIDYVTKPEEGGIARLQAFCDELIRKVRTAAGVDVRRILEIRRERKARHKTQQAHPISWVAKQVRPVETKLLADQCIAIGISTGGPPALTQLFESLKPPMPPIVVVQHMPPRFTASLAWRLNMVSELSIKEAAEGDVLQPNLVLIAPGGSHLELRRHGAAVQATIFNGDPVSGHKPSIDVMMTSVAQVFGASVLGLIMTGMGHDGAAGCGVIRKAGGYVLGQDETSSDVYGMNKVAFTQGHVDRQFSLDEAAAIITKHVMRRRP